MTTTTHIIIITLICLIIASLALLALLGKLDRWYHWSQPDDDKPSEQRIQRWRRVFAIGIFIALALIILSNVSDIIDDYVTYILLALAAGGAIIEHKWVKKV